MSTAAYRIFAGIFLPEIQDMILDGCGMVTIYELGRTSKAVRRRTRSYCRRRYHRELRRFVETPVSFRDVLRRSLGIVSGSVALHYLAEPSGWVPGDMDVYASPSGSAMIMDYLIDKENYNLTSVHNMYGGVGWSSRKSVLEVSKFERPGDSVKIDLITCVDSNLVTCITSFHSTVVMNILTADSVYSLYPRLTFMCRGFWGLAPRLTAYSQTTHDAMDKYRRRGYNIQIGTGSWKRPCGSYCPVFVRRFDSVHTFHYVFCVSGESSIPASSAWTSVRWRLGIECKNRFCTHSGSVMRM